MDKEPVVYVIGGDHYNTYGIIRSLGAAGIKSRVLVLGCGSRRSFVLRSRHAAGGGGFLAHAEALDYLEKNRPESGKGIVICCSDEALELVLDNYSRLSKDYILPVCSDYGETARLMNKSAITSLAASFGMKVPQSHTVKDRAIPEGIGYPCITKPLVSTAGH
ncbi:MAG: hypothetical protein IJS66_00780, partial [Bacteroidales bacterium]|nr:hypothetical protein [Bacteroidales bacterium]